jgi:hypothetical protein
MDRRWIGRVAVVTAQAFVLHGLAVASPGVERSPGEWVDVPRVIAVGDLHGSYDKAVRLLQGAELVGEDLHWIGGEQHLVVAGDMLDRGTRDRPLMDFMRRLQEESEAAGGRVHALLGNHEAMNLMRDLRYVNPLSNKDWAKDEDPGGRKAAWKTFARVNRGRDSKANLAEAFKEKYPPGFFARQESFNPEGEYGAWLLGLPAVVKVNDVIYVHGGLNFETATLGIDEINRQLTDSLREQLEARQVLEARNIVSPLMSYGEILWVAREGLRNAGEISPALSQAVSKFIETAESPLVGGKGPLWYRGNSFEDERIEREMLERSLELLGAKAMVVAHSPTPSKKITSRFHGQLYRVDHNIGQSEELQALVVGADEVMVLVADTQQTLQPETELPIGRVVPNTEVVLSEPDQQQYLRQAEVTDWRYLGRGSTRPRLLDLQMDDRTQRGFFKTVENGEDPSPGTATDRYQHEVAAYRLDRQLGLNMVPVTVIRELDGQSGSLQTWVEGAVDLEAAREYNLDLFDAAVVSAQLAQGEIFDALIGNQDRGLDDILCRVGQHDLLLIDHSKAFSTSTEIGWDVGKSVNIDPELSAALQPLDRESLRENLGDLISERQIEAVLERRDKILDFVVTADGEAATDTVTAESGTSGTP